MFTATARHHVGNPTSRPVALSLANLLILGLMNLPLLRALALPLGLSAPLTIAEEDEGKSPEDASLWIYLAIALALVLMGGIFAGLTIAYASSSWIQPFLLVYHELLTNMRLLDLWDKTK
jgi:metal transporter CNNM